MTYSVYTDSRANHGGRKDTGSRTGNVEQPKVVLTFDGGQQQDK